MCHVLPTKHVTLNWHVSRARDVHVHVTCTCTYSKHVPPRCFEALLLHRRRTRPTWLWARPAWVTCREVPCMDARAWRPVRSHTYAALIGVSGVPGARWLWCTAA